MRLGENHERFLRSLMKQNRVALVFFPYFCFNNKKGYMFPGLSREQLLRFTFLERVWGDFDVRFRRCDSTDHPDTVLHVAIGEFRLGDGLN